jgi:hypothetical protein
MEDHPEIGVVVDLLQHRGAAGAGQQFLGTRQCLALHGGQGLSVHVVAGYLLEQRRFPT